MKVGPGPQPPAIVSPIHLTCIRGACDELAQDSITLREILAAVNYFIEKQQWSETNDR